MKHQKSRVNLQYVINVMIKHRLLIGVIVGLSTGITFFSLLSSPDIYRSAATIAVNPEGIQSVSLLRKEQLVTNATLKELVNSEMALLLSSTVIRSAIQEIKPDYFANMTEMQISTEVAEIEGSLTSFPIRNALLSQIQLENEDPEFLASLLNQLVPSRLHLMVQSRENQVTDDYKRMLESANHAIDSLDVELNNVQLEKDVYDADKQLSAIVSEKTDNDSKILEIRQSIMRATLSIDALNKALESENDVDGMMYTKNNQSLQDLLAHYRKLMRDEKQLEGRLVSSDPGLIEIGEEIEQVKRQIRGEVTQQIKIYELERESNEVELRNRIQTQQNFEAKLTSIPRLAGIIERIKTEREKQLSTINLLRDQQNESQIALMQLKSARYLELVSPAVVPSDPVKPRRILSTLAAFILSVVLSLVLSFMIESLSNVIESPDDLEHFLDVEVVAIVRDVHAKKKA